MAVDHPITESDLCDWIPARFEFQDSPGIDALGEGFGGSYLVPDDFLGYLATSLDYFTAEPDRTGLRTRSTNRHPAGWLVQLSPIGLRYQLGPF